MKDFIKILLREHLNENIGRNELLKKADEISKSGKYLNCHLFSQLLLNYVDKKTDLLKLNFNLILNKNQIKNIEKLKIGDLLEFDDISHYSIYIGNNQLIEVEQWG